MNAEQSPFTPEELAEASRYPMLIEWSDEDQLFLVSLPDFGVVSHATTITGAAERGVEMAAEWIDSYRRLGRPVPAPSTIPLAAAS
jgi:predicted RNase H-like HicB family nuclease